jgi:predicted transglutaminase-like cysteine proteinase
MTKTFLKGLIAAAIVTFAGAAQATPLSMITLGKTNPPIGHYEFCKNYPSKCGPTQDAGPLQLTEAKWKTLLKVNYAANSAIEPLTDKEIYGVEERWTYPTDVGDCEDYVLLKQKMLIERGFSPADLLITVVLQPNGDGHAVLVVRTDRGDFVLDNMRNKVLLWSETEYTFLKRQSSRDAAQWVKIEDQRAPVVGSLN